MNMFWFVLIDLSGSIGMYESSDYKYLFFFEKICIGCTYERSENGGIDG